MLDSHAIQCTTNTGLLRPTQGALTLHSDVGKDVNNWLIRTNTALRS